MVSNRCKITVKEILRKMDLHFIIVELGEVEIMENLSDEQRLELIASLFKVGLEMIDNKKAILIERIKNVVIELVHYADALIKINFSDYLSEKLHYDYTYMANVFSEVQGTTIEQFIISHKVERIKELIIYGDLNITEIAKRMNYSSVAHLSSQFKKITGLSPTHFKKMKNNRRIPIEDIC
jgi:AraC-like DNA-binding protein